jgi:rSAM/selenodomain-associated transferase 2
MRAPLSIVIPTLNAADELPATAEALMAGTTAGLVRELIISDGGSSDATVQVARELGAVIVSGEAGRGGQLSRGVAAASGEWVLLLHADTQLGANWHMVAFEHITHHPDTAGWFRLQFRSQGIGARLVAGGANLRARALGLPFGDQGLLVSRAVLEQAGGVPEIPLMEDVALARALKGRLRGLDCAALTSAVRYERDGWLRRTIRNLGTLIRYFLGTSPEVLKKRYER